MEYLTKVKGVPLKENGVSRTYTHHKTYFLCENKRNMSLLNESEYLKEVNNWGDIYRLIKNIQYNINKNKGEKLCLLKEEEKEKIEKLSLVN